MEDFNPIITVFSDSGVVMSQNQGSVTLFAGVVRNAALEAPQPLERLVSLLVDAFNNRTRERNYFKLYSEMLDGDVSEDFFNREIEEHKDDYVVPVGTRSEAQDVYLALKITPKLKCIDSSDDFVSLFAFCDASVLRLLQ